MSPKPSRICKAFSTDSKSEQTRLVSSANWLNYFNFISEQEHSLNQVALANFFSNKLCRQHKWKGRKGTTLPNPSCKFNPVNGKTIINNSAFYIVIEYFNPSPNSFSKVEYFQGVLYERPFKGLQKSNASSTSGVFVAFVCSMKLLISLIFSPTYHPLIKPVWSACIRCGNMGSIVLAVAFDAIL